MKGKKLQQWATDAHVALRAAQKTVREQHKAILAASEAMDAQTGEILALRRIVIAERAQVIFYTDRCIAYAEHRCLDLKVPDYLQQPESVQEEYLKRAILDLNMDESILPHVPKGTEKARIIQ